MNTGSQDFFPWDEIPDVDVLESGKYLMRGKALDDGVASTGVRMFSCQMEVEQPEALKGMSMFENFVTGTQEILLGIVPTSMGARRMKRMLTSATIPGGNSVAQQCASFVGCLFGVTVNKFTEKDGEYAGQERNRIAKFWKVGEEVPGITPAGAGGVSKGLGAASQAAAAASAPPVPTIVAPGATPAAVVEIVAEAPTPPLVVPGLPMAPVVPAAPIVPAAPPQGLIQVPVAPVAPAVDVPGAPPTATPAGAAPPIGAGVAQVPCGICKQMINVVDLATHVATCAAGQGVT